MVSSVWMRSAAKTWARISVTSGINMAAAAITPALSGDVEDLRLRRDRNRIEHCWNLRPLAKLLAPTEQLGAYLRYWVDAEVCNEP